MSNEEEAMELSGESNLVSNLHNFSFDVSWSHKEPSPPVPRRPLQILSPARFNVSTPKTNTSWKSSMLKEKLLSPVPQPKVKLSQKTVANYHDQSVERRQSYSPMELDHSDTQFDFKESDSSMRKRHSDIGLSNSNYINDRSKTIPKMQHTVESVTSRRRKTDSVICNNTTLEDSVFSREELHNNTNSTEKSKLRNYNDRNDRRIVNEPDNMSQSSCIVLMFVLVICSSIMVYIYYQMSWCNIFDIDTVKLSHKLEDNVFGQHIAVKTIVDVLEDFEKNVRSSDNGKRNLVLSFHGWTGIGKNYVSRFVAESFYNAKVSLYLGPLHLVDRYNYERGDNTVPITKWIIGNITKCGVNVIIIDEIDKAEKHYLDGIQSAIESVNEKSMVKTNSVLKPSAITVFILLSNSRSSQINHFLFSQMLVERERNLIRKSEFDDIFEDSKSEWYDNLKSKGLIDVFIPFLPLAESHVKQCIERNFVKKGRNPSESLVSSVMEELSFVDMGGKNGQISLTGCKRVEDKVNLHIDD
ncbi:hypothetical protein ACF0H5_021640 [Mactra antiquata]